MTRRLVPIDKLRACIARGLTSPEAAAEIGFHPITLQRAAKAHGIPWPRRPAIVPVRVRGVDYPSINAAAAALGLAPNTLSYHLATHGHADLAGVGQVRPKHRGNTFSAKPLAIGPVTFISHRAAAEALGMGVKALRNDLRTGGEVALARLMARDARAADAALWNAEMVDGRPTRGRPTEALGGRPRGQRSIEAERLLREGVDRATVRAKTGLSASSIRRIAGKIGAERRAAA